MMDSVGAKRTLSPRTGKIVFQIFQAFTLAVIELGVYSGRSPRTRHQISLIFGPKLVVLIAQAAAPLH
jgi:hypothetical protein